MAVDTRDKRFSMLGLARATVRLFQNPTGSVSAAARTMLVGLYSGIALSGVAASSVLRRRQRFTHFTRSLVSRNGGAAVPGVPRIQPVVTWNTNATPIITWSTSQPITTWDT